MKVSEVVCAFIICAASFLSHVSFARKESFPVYLRSLIVYDLHENKAQGNPEFVIKCAGSKTKTNLTTVIATNHEYQWDPHSLFVTDVPFDSCRDCQLEEEDNPLSSEVLGTLSICTKDFSPSGSLFFSHRKQFTAQFSCARCHSGFEHMKSSNESFDDWEEEIERWKESLKAMYANPTPVASLWRFISTMGSSLHEPDNYEGHVDEWLWDIEEFGFYKTPDCGPHSTASAPLPAAEVKLIGNDEQNWHGTGIEPPYSPHSERWYVYEPEWGGSYIQVQLKEPEVVQCLFFHTWQGENGRHRPSRFPQKARLEYSVDDGSSWKIRMEWDTIDQENPIKILTAAERTTVEGPFGLTLNSEDPNSEKDAQHHSGRTAVLILFPLGLTVMSVATSLFAFVWWRKLKQAKENARQMEYVDMVDQPDLTLAFAQDEQAMQAELLA
eukprot:CAMPEP_0196580882 /NCGR_PEP_ID=MMETSP1081-20130531/31248_1 /TAXON_ID=36882 /ORGANISM="Pyramimonas amylifera, Strain CCMP720" /LENGTH=439 /DNA_ID=CAMNT_0041900903 /DNA_START=183 /DNA_END=1502 /DNA_ORIENTATION=-